MTYKTYFGKEIESVIEDLGELRIKVFRDFPYLYEGSLAYEREYLKIYINSPRSFLFSVWDDGAMVGATTCIPLTDESHEVQAPFEEAGWDIKQIFYFGESILLKPYRGKGLGKRFFEERENHARSFGDYKIACFCGVERPVSHPLRPIDFLPLDAFWESRGYKKQENLRSYFEWKDIDEGTESAKPMIYWTKEL